MEAKISDCAFRLGVSEQEFEEVIKELRPLLVWRVAAVVKGQADHEDVVQQALLECFANLSSFDGTVKLSTWITRTVDRRALDAIRNAPEWVETILADEEEEHEKPEASYEVSYDLAIDLKKGIMALTPVQREIMLAVHVEGYSIYEYAAKSGRSHKLVWYHLDAAKKAMRDYLSAYEA